MPEFLTQEWLDAVRELAQDQPESAGASTTIQHVVTGGPGGDVKCYWVLENGRPVESRLGATPEPELTLTSTYEDAVRIQQGDLDPNAAFMQGRLKVAGNMGPLLALLARTMSPDYERLQERIRAITQY